MRFIDQAIQEHTYEELDGNIRSQTWGMFAEAVKGKELWIFGLGEGASFFFEQYGDKFRVSGVLDNDIRKQGQPARKYISYIEEGAKEVEVLAPTVLQNRLLDEIIVLITSVRYGADIYSQLVHMGVPEIFSLFAMEVNARMGKSMEATEESCEMKFAKECSKLPIERNKILLARDECGGHGKEILLQLHGMKPELDLVWITDRNSAGLPKGIRVIPTSNHREYIRELETAHIWLFGDMIPDFAIKRQEQVYIQIKHWASLTLKKFYMDLPAYLEIPAVREYYIHNNKAIDYMLVGSKFDEDSCRSGFDFHGECISVGSPRSDVLFRKDVRSRVLSNLKIDARSHVLLYAPTFRARDGRTVASHMREVDLDFFRLRKSLEKRFGGEWQLLLRAHPDVAMESMGMDLPDYVKNVSFYPDSQELVAASDVLISDYSSIMFEPAFIRRPVFRYAPDMENYIGSERELLMDYNSLPFPLAKSNDELEQCVLHFNLYDYKDQLDKMFSTYGVNEDGRASYRAAVFILGVL